VRQLGWIRLQASSSQGTLASICVQVLSERSKNTVSVTSILSTQAHYGGEDGLIWELNEASGDLFVAVLDGVGGSRKECDPSNVVAGRWTDKWGTPRVAQPKTAFCRIWKCPCLAGNILFSRGLLVHVTKRCRPARCVSLHVLQGCLPRSIDWKAHQAQFRMLLINLH
jgi:hypothetical protein